MLTKKKIVTMMAAGAVFAFALTGCGSGDSGTNSQSSQASDSQQSQAESNDSQSGQGESNESQQTGQGGGYQFQTGSVTLGADMDMDALKSGLGEEQSVFEAPSCAGQGTAYIYSYGSFEVETYPDDGKNLIARITLKDDTVATAEGIDLSKTKDDIISTYGDDYTENDSGITYTKDGMKLIFILDGDNITSIEYASAALG